MCAEPQLIGYIGSDCPNGGERPHVSPVRVQSSARLLDVVLSGGYAPDIETGPCEACRAAAS